MSKQCATKMEQLGCLLTAMIAVIVGGSSELRISKKAPRFAPVLEDTPDNRYICKRVAWRLHLSRQYVEQIAFGKRYSERVVASLNRAKRMQEIRRKQEAANSSSTRFYASIVEAALDEETKLDKQILLELRRTKRAAHLTPLNVEFTDLFFGMRRNFIGKIIEKVFTDFPDFHYSNYLASRKRMVVLRRTPVMPSVVIDSLASALHCTAAERASINLASHHVTVLEVAHAIGVDEQVIYVCWKTEADLDAQWHMVRNELLALRAEFAAKASGERKGATPLPSRRAA
jgi:hypothetical protein